MTEKKKEKVDENVIEEAKKKAYSQGIKQGRDQIALEQIDMLVITKKDYANELATKKQKGHDEITVLTTDILNKQFYRGQKKTLQQIKSSLNQILASDPLWFNTQSFTDFGIRQTISSGLLLVVKDIVENRYKLEVNDGN